MVAPPTPGPLSAAVRGARRAAPRLALAATLLLAASSAHAQRCRIVTVTDPVVFTGYSPFGGGVEALLTVTYDCPPPVASAWLGISTPRAMTGPGTLAFEIYGDSGHTDVWPSGPTRPVSPAGGTVTLFAFLPPQDAAAGAYAGTIDVAIHTLRSADVATVQVSATVLPACRIDPAALAFGSYDPGASTPRDAAGTLTIACTGGTTYAVGLGPGGSHSGTTRQMASGAARLQYELYTDAGRTTVWTATTTAGGTVASTAPVPLPVYGRVPAGQPVPAGPYADTVQSTIDFF